MHSHHNSTYRLREKSSSHVLRPSIPLKILLKDQSKPVLRKTSTIMFYTQVLVDCYPEFAIAQGVERKLNVA
ncbi:hypothetical protein TNCV_4569101 [Trichonephila clavipes]|nr:hypothetical protein TNCV_4569101 [Trichonephila clavipes]